MISIAPLRRVGFALAACALLAAPAAAADGPLVTTDWLEKNLSDPKIRLVEVSVDPGVYERGHISGAHNVSWHTDLVDVVRRDIAGRDQFQALARRLGIGADTTVILYGDNNNWFAAWGAWLFEVYGVNNVKLLDGGRRKWELEKRALDTRTPSARPSDIVIGEPNLRLRARLSDVLAVAEGRSDEKLIDIRSPDEFSGKIFAPQGSQELSVRAGHVPGAVNVPWSRAVNPDTGAFRSPEELKRIYAEVGLDGSKPIIAYCRIGERSSHTWFALSKILGYDVRNYDGSWTEYGNSVGSPIANPAGTVWASK